MTYIADLETARDQVAARIKDVTAKAKPSYSVDGQTVSWTAYLTELRKQLKDLNDLIAAGDPVEVASIGYN